MSVVVDYLEQGEEEVEVRAPAGRAVGQVEDDLLVAAGGILEGRDQVKRHRVRDANHGGNGPEKDKKQLYQHLSFYPASSHVLV